MFRAHVLIVRRTKLNYTASGISPVHRLREDSVHGTATYRCDDTRDCIIQFCPPDDKQMCSKHVEAWNKLIIKFSASHWLILINKYIEMHGEQNIKTLHVSDSSSVRHQEFFTVHTAMVFVIQVCWQLMSRIRMELHPDPSRDLSANLYEK